MKHLILAVLLSLPLSGYCEPAQDMWTGGMIQKKLFQPHPDKCDSSEVFVAFGSTPGKGFCIEKAQRSAAAWADARQICAEADKRLPEPIEYRAACLNPPAGLIGMTGDKEWATNFASRNDTRELQAYAAGELSCSDLESLVAMGYFFNDEETAAFRCVR